MPELFDTTRRLAVNGTARWILGLLLSITASLVVVLSGWLYTSVDSKLQTIADRIARLESKLDIQIDRTQEQSSSRIARLARIEAQFEFLERTLRQRGVLGHDPP